jgi:hypothetical protein
MDETVIRRMVDNSSSNQDPLSTWDSKSETFKKQLPQGKRIQTETMYLLKTEAGYS